jgi:IS30 family transposase
VSIVERKTGFTLIQKVKRKTVLAVSQAMIGLLKPHRKKVRTITSDNGKKFAGHEEIARKLKANFYFAHPYSSWKRGTNENTNGLIRQYFPKNRDFTTIMQQEFNMAMERLNNRPQKRLGYQTPNQIFLRSGVALHI